jgi:hypothetical protein
VCTNIKKYKKRLMTISGKSRQIFSLTLTVVLEFFLGHLLVHVTHFGWWVIKSGRHFCCIDEQWLQVDASENIKKKINLFFKVIKEKFESLKPDTSSISWRVWVETQKKNWMLWERIAVIDKRKEVRVNVVDKFQNIFGAFAYFRSSLRMKRWKKMPKTSSKHQKCDSGTLKSVWQPSGVYIWRKRWSVFWETFRDSHRRRKIILKKIKNMMKKFLSWISEGTFETFKSAHKKLSRLLVLRKPRLL